MEVTTTYKAADRREWRSWLERNHQTASEIWLLFDDAVAVSTVSYLDAVEEALCFGWIDGIQKRVSSCERAQRFTPRKKRSHWTELNKERSRRLIRLGLMTEAGLYVLPNLTDPWEVPVDIVKILQAEPIAWKNFQAFPDLYKRVRISYIEEVRKNPPEFQKRMQNFLAKTALNKLFGNWNDGGRLS
jgi:uncharacterized protein YdeI (YjbR/CyaY-like superfamily)